MTINILQQNSMTIINLMDGLVNLGFVNINEVSEGYQQFESLMSEEKYLELFKGNSFYEIENIEVHKEFVGKGYGKILMNNAIKVCYDKVMYLNASPVRHCTLELDELIEFYNKFGFVTISEIEESEDNKEMIRIV